ncbi:nodulin-26-like [Humulus lupulus]|uniref:nodulin-26-like n=1 Tax=Humulus lupulus TaxID=3486 RepID=UPI002B410B55|nr:nodulin-26-like [Humulus lupulus]
MANSPSTFAGPSPKLGLSIEQSFMEEGKSKGFQEYTIKVDKPPSSFQKMVAELIGTYFLIFIGCGAAIVNKIEPLTIVGIAIVWGLVLMAAIYALGHVSGAHFNPAVTLALAAARKFPLKHVPMYVVSQLVGATLASLTLRVLFNDEDSIRTITTHYSPPTTDLEAITWEFIITFLLMFTISGVATDHRACKDLSGLAVGAVLLVNVMVAGPITGASMNPARSIGPAVVSGIYTKIWVFIVSPILGAMAATLVYSIVRVPKPEISGSTTKSTYNHMYLQSKQ